MREQLQAMDSVVSLKRRAGDLLRPRGRLKVPVGRSGRLVGVGIGVASYVTVTVGAVSG